MDILGPARGLLLRKVLLLCAALHTLNICITGSQAQTSTSDAFFAKYKRDTEFYGQSPYSWQEKDAFDMIDERMNRINKQNCREKSPSDLFLPMETLSQVPRYNELLSSVIYKNRTNLLHLHNMALNRAFFWSYIFQRLDKPEDFERQPSLMYHYFSLSSSLTANQNNINASSILYDRNATYANWFSDLPFNTTLKLFGARSWRNDNYNSPINWRREPSNASISMVDLAAGGVNYAKENNQWYKTYLPDGFSEASFDSVRKQLYSVSIKYAAEEGGRFEPDTWQSFPFMGPASPGQWEADNSLLPVVFTPPYFDCGGHNRWLVSAVSPVVDWIPRYLDWLHIRRFRFVAVTTQDIWFRSVDINQCPLSLGNEPPNIYAGTARCKPTTRCEPIPGWGFRRGGYQCACEPGYRYPTWQNGPFLGGDIESSTAEEYENGFECEQVLDQNIVPVIRYNASTIRRKKRDLSPQLNLAEFDDMVKMTQNRSKEVHHDQVQTFQNAMQREYANFREKFEMEHPEYRPARGRKRKLVTPVLAGREGRKRTRFVSRRKRDVDPNLTSNLNLNDVIRRVTAVNQDTCQNVPVDQLRLPGNVAYNVEEVFSNQARTAVRLAHFLTYMYNYADLSFEEYGTWISDRVPNKDQLFAEVISNVAADVHIKGSGIFYDSYQFSDEDGSRDLFGPYAFRDESATPETDDGKPFDGPGEEIPMERVSVHFKAVDMAGYPDGYTNKDFFQEVKQRWKWSSAGKQRFAQWPWLRNGKDGAKMPHYMFPMYFKVAQEKDGWWSAPYFICGGLINDWIITYSIPFFGKGNKFMGVVTVDVKLSHLDVNQCPQDYYVFNAFKGSALCDQASTYCVHLPNRGFVRGSYKCECRQGYEYPLRDNGMYFDGQSLESENDKRLNGTTNKFHTLKCRSSTHRRQAANSSRRSLSVAVGVGVSLALFAGLIACCLIKTKQSR